LVGKKALGYKLDGRSYLYHPLVRRSECAEAATHSFVERVFGGSLKPMLAHFVARKRLSREEILELKKLLESQE
jgi:BlaI family penicillinase repressor